MSPADAFRTLEKIWQAKHLEAGAVMRSRQCAACLKLQRDALEAEMDALAFALDCLRNKAGGTR